MLRQAVDILLTQSKGQSTVWLLFENNPGHPGRLVGVFSSLALAMQSGRIQEVIGAGTWQERTPLLWVCEPSGEEHLYFSLEGWRIDRLGYEQSC
jgi:hypothetical protein